MRVDKDGSTQLFTLPESELTLGVMAPAGTGLAVLNSHHSSGAGFAFVMYRFDGQGNLVAQHDLSLDFAPVVMAVSSSGNVTLVGYQPTKGDDEASRKFFGAILNADDQVQHLFEIPPSATGAAWVPPRYATMEAADGVAHLVLQSGESADDPNFGLAAVEESGNVRIIPLDTVRGTRAHQWFLGTGVAAELYQFAGEQPMVHWALYDITSGNKLGTKSIARPAGFSYACFLGNEVSMLALAHSAHVEKSRGLPPDALRLVTMKLE